MQARRADIQEVRNDRRALLTAGCLLDRRPLSQRLSKGIDAVPMHGVS